MEIAADFPGLLRLHKDGSVVRFFSAPYAAPSPTDPDPETSVLSKDINIKFPSSASAATIPARIYLPARKTTTKLPVIVYFHGGGFCVESAFSNRCHRYVNHLAAATAAAVVSVEYRLAPEHPLPAAYNDAWAALQWVAAHSTDHFSGDQDPWVAAHADFASLFIGGDSAGANIAHNLATRASNEELPGRVNITGAFLFHTYFIDTSGPHRPDPGPAAEGKWTTALSYKLWELVYPDAPGGPSSPMINPFGPGAPSLAKLGCSRVLVAVGGEDELREVNVKYYEAVKGSGYGGEVAVEVVEGEGHAFQVFDPVGDKARVLLRRLGCFLLGGR